EVSTNAITVDASAWTSGVYNVRITTSNASIIVKQVVKQ
ncbi:MAG: T9SS type A sorting domain-containing protein, partial [Bacteroidales bacterium]|nr:T9SS type A sorting domain-containing protein [Bacteroidales bacterium]